MSDMWGMRTVVLKSVLRMKSSGRVMRLRSSRRVISPQKVFSSFSPRLLITGKPQCVQPSSTCKQTDI